VAEHKPKIVFLTSPNNPDGSVIAEEDLLQILALPVLVVLDEAYIEFCTDVPSRIKWVQQYDNLVVLRTFSKCAALAGLRVGYGAFPLGMIEYLWRAKQPYNVSVAAEVSPDGPCVHVSWQRVCSSWLVLTEVVDSALHLCFATEGCM
jgi:histidinol-phosphate aminotransferase